jgi:abortive infection bacteriophage resistance protein
MIYTKPAITVDDQIVLLKNRGLIINNEQFAKDSLLKISYYRLAGYWWPLQSDKVNHTFKPNSKFETVIKIYEFDSELRTLLFDVIEQIEIAVRSKMNYYLSLEDSPWWFENDYNFSNITHFQDTLKLIDKQLIQSKKEVFLTEHYRKYTNDKRRPPSWKTLEVLSLGCLSKVYGNLKPKLSSKDRIAKDLGAVNHTYLVSWLQAIAQIRNICAHHGRIWNKNLPCTVNLLSKPPFPWIKNVPTRKESQMLYVHLCVMKYLLNRLNPKNNFTYRLLSLLEKYPNIDPVALGLKKDWQKEPLWSNKIDGNLYRFRLIYKKTLFLILNSLKK